MQRGVNLGRLDALFQGRIKALIIVSVISVLLSIFGSAFAQDIIGIEQLKSVATQKGSVRVIVELELSQPYTSLSKLSSNQKLSQRLAIRSMQNKVLDSHSANILNTPKRFKNHPYVVINTNAIGLEALSKDPRIKKIEIDKVLRPVLDLSIPYINADDAHVQGHTGLYKSIGVLDTGVRSDHEMFGKYTIQREACFSTEDVASGITSLCPNGEVVQIGEGAGEACDATEIEGCSHGTHVAVIAAGRNPNSPIGTGVAPDSFIVPVQIFSKFSNASDCYPSAAPCLLTFDSDVALGLEYLYDIIDYSDMAAVNLSIGGGAYDSYCSSTLLGKLIVDLWIEGIVTVVSSGNDGYNGAVSYPACVQNAITVGATLNATDAIASFSNHAEMVDILAPGTDILSASAETSSSYVSWSGTSMAAPHVAGAFAVLKGSFPDKTMEELESALLTTGVDITRAGITVKRLDLLSAVEKLGRVPVIGPKVVIESVRSGNDGRYLEKNQALEFDVVLVNRGDGTSENEHINLIYKESPDADPRDGKIVDQFSIDSLIPGQIYEGYYYGVESPFTNVNAVDVPRTAYYQFCLISTQTYELLPDTCSDNIITTHLYLQADDYENDNQPETANILAGSGAMQIHNLHDEYDEDWFKFTLDSNVINITLETHGPNRNADETLMVLYDSELNEIASDTNGGFEGYSKINMTALSTGTYFVKVTENGQDDYIDQYRITLNYEDGLSGDNYEYDDQANFAKAILNGETQYRSIHKAGDVDWLKFDLAEGVSNLVIQTIGNEAKSTGTMVRLYDASGRQIKISGGDKRLSDLRLNSLAAGSYYIRLSEYQNNNAISAYEISLSYSKGLGPDAYESNDLVSQATLIGRGESQSHSIHRAGDVDWLKFDLNAGVSNLVLETTGSSSEGMMVRLYNSQGKQITANGGENRFSKIVIPFLAKGTYYARVTKYGNNAPIDQYTISLNYDIGDQFESDDHQSQATILVNGVAQLHSIHRAGDVDWYQFTLNKRAYNVNLRALGGSGSGGTMMRLYNHKGTQIGHSGGENRNSNLWRATLAAGTYYVKVTKFGNNAPIERYEIKLSH